MGTTDIGAQLRSSREALGWSVASLAQRIRVQPRIIAAIEQNDVSAIPPKPYGRGFIRAYAREVGLDPEQMVQTYFAQFASAAPETRATPPEPQPWPMRGSGLVSAGILVAALLLLASFQGNSSTDAVETAATPAPVGTTGSANAHDATAGDSDRARNATPPAAVEDGTNRRASAGTVSAALPEPSGFALVLEADRECWVSARADGERVLYELMKAGTSRTIRAQRAIVLRAGDAGALRLTLDGRSIGPFGRSGEVRTAHFTPANGDGAARRQPQ